MARQHERHEQDDSRFPGRGWTPGPAGEPPGWRGDAGLGHASSGDYESLRRTEPPRYGEWAGREQARGYCGRGPKNYARSDRNAWPYDKGVAPGSMSSQRAAETGHDAGMIESAIEQMPPREQEPNQE